MAAAICQINGMQVMDPVKVQALIDAPWIGLPFQFQDTLFGLFSRPDLDHGTLLTAAAVTIMPLAPGHHGGAHRRYVRHLLHL